MNLLFDVIATQPNPTGKRHGGGKYGEIVLFRMIERGIHFSCVYTSEKWLNPEVKSRCEQAGIPMIDLTNSDIETVIKENQIDVLFSCLPDHFAHVTSCKVIGTIHGLRLIETPFDYIDQYYRHGKFKWRLWKQVKAEIDGSRRLRIHQKVEKMILKKNFNFVTVSNHSKYSILSQFPQLQEKDVKVFYSPSTSSCKLVQKKSEKAQKYFLMVSANRRDKNIVRGVMALDRLFSMNKLQDCKVIVLGYKKKTIPWWKRWIRKDGDFFFYSLQNKDRFEFKDYVSEEELDSLYANATTMVYPSLNEGFGYPPLEAMRYGVPVVASAVSAIPEVCGDAALYFNPFSVEEIMNRVLMIQNPDNYRLYSQRALDRYRFITEIQKRDLDALIDYILS